MLRFDSSDVLALPGSSMLACKVHITPQINIARLVSIVPHCGGAGAGRGEKVTGVFGGGVECSTWIYM